MSDLPSTEALSEKITINANDKCWIEQPAVEQLKAVAALPGVVRAVGLPDLHPGTLRQHMGQARC